MVAKMTHKKLIKGWQPYTREECARYTAKGFWSNLTMCDLLDRNALHFPDKRAFIDEKTQVTWKGLQQKVNRLAIHLQRQDIKYGDFFVLQLPNIVEFIYFYLALNRLGAIPVLCLPRHRQAEVDHVLRLHQARGVVVSTEEKFNYVGMVNDIRGSHPYLKSFLAVGSKVPGGWTSVDMLLKEEVEKQYPDDYLKQFKPAPDDICSVQFTAGTTGLPKAAPRTHNDYIFGWSCRGRLAGYTDDSVPMVVIPIAHDAAFVCHMGPAMLNGATTVLCKSREAEKQFEMIEKHHVTVVLLIPIQIVYWIQAQDKLKNYNLSSLKVVMSAAEKLRPEFARWVLDDLGVDFLECFGMTEGPAIWNRWDSPRESQIYTIGKPVLSDPESEIRLVDDENREVKLGEIGEMVAKGPLIFKGYFRNDEENKKAFDEQGYFHSGDLMSLREDGRFVFEGRKKEMIKRAGESVYPAAIEDKLSSFRKVAHCAAVGMPDPILGEKLCVFVQPVKGETLSLDEIVQYLKGLGVAVYTLPERLELVEGWPLTAKGSIDKKSLRAYVTAKAVQEGAITREFGNEYLRRDKLTIDDIAQGRFKVEFTGTPS